MAQTWRYRGQEISSEQITLLREFIRVHSTSSRWKLSRQLCEEWGWKQPNGALRDVVCRGLLLMLERAGQIELPPVRGMGKIRAERKFENPFDFDETHKLWIDANHKPVIRGTDASIWDRLVTIPFDVVIPEDEKDLTPRPPRGRAS